MTALHADTVEELLILVEQDSLVLGVLEGQLGPEGRRFLRQFWSYCARWKAEGGPHMEQRTRERVRGLADRIPLLGRRQPSYRVVVRASLPPWDDPRTRRLRGQFVGILEEPIQPAGTGASEPPRMRAPSVRPRLDKVQAREDDILSALPASNLPPLKTQTELAQKLARTGSPSWDRRTLGRSIRVLRDNGLVDGTRLRRSAKGDRHVSH